MNSNQLNWKSAGFVYFINQIYLRNLKFLAYDLGGDVFIEVDDEEKKRLNEKTLFDHCKIAVYKHFVHKTCKDNGRTLKNSTHTKIINYYLASLPMVDKYGEL